MSTFFNMLVCLILPSNHLPYLPACLHLPPSLSLSLPISLLFFLPLLLSVPPSPPSSFLSLLPFPSSFPSHSPIVCHALASSPFSLHSPCSHFMTLFLPSLPLFLPSFSATFFPSFHISLSLLLQGKCPYTPLLSIEQVELLFCFWEKRSAGT